MRRETLALHFGYSADGLAPTTAVPIYQTAAYEFESAEHAAALFNLEVDGFRYSRISNPTTDVLERRVAAMEGGVAALAVSSGQAAMHFATLNVVSSCRQPVIVSQPQDQSVAAGASAILTVAATGTSITYQWYEGQVFDFTNPVGGSSPTLVTPPITTTAQFWARVVTPCGTVNSVAVTVTPGRRRPSRSTGSCARPPPIWTSRPPRACARPADRSSSSATASSGPGVAAARCQARRSGFTPASVTSAHAR